MNDELEEIIKRSKSKSIKVTFVVLCLISILQFLLWTAVGIKYLFFG